MKATNYIYASAKIRALEPKILDETDIERMVDAPDLTSAFRVLNDTDYADNLLDLQPTDYRTALSRDFQQLFDFFQKVIPQQELFNLILLERDFVNIRLLFKEKYFKVNVDEFLKENVTYSPNHLKDFIFENHDYPPKVIKAYLDEKKGQVLDQVIKDVIYDVDKQVTEKTRPDELDAMLTQKYFDVALKLAQTIGSTFIINYLKLEIDTNNILIWLRARRLKLTKEQLNEKLIRGSNADIRKMIALFPEDPKSLRSFVNANYDMHVLRAFDDYGDNDTLFEFEKTIRDYQTRYLQLAKNFSYGPEVVYAYWYAKRKAINNIRIILTAKMNNIPAEAIKETLREIY